MGKKILTAKSIADAIERLTKEFPPPPRGWPDIMSFGISGMQITEAPVKLIPRIKLGAAAPVSDEFRTEFDAWLVAMFGVREECAVPLHTAYLFGRNILMRHDDVLKIRSLT